MTPASISPRGWKPNELHGVPGFTRWRVTPDGIVREGESTPRRTQWEKAKANAQKAFDLYGDLCMTLSHIWSPWVDARTLIATICCESAVNPTASRDEPHISDKSFGLCQILTGTAYQVGRRIGWPLASEANIEGSTIGLPGKPTSIGGSTPLEAWEPWLSEPWNNIVLAAALHTINDERLSMQGDPLLQYIAFNSGGNYESKKTWCGLHYHPSAADAFELFFNDASAIL